MYEFSTIGVGNINIHGFKNSDSIIQKALDNVMSDSVQKALINIFEKGGKWAVEGEEREWAGRKFKKQNGKWIPSNVLVFENITNYKVDTSAINNHFDKKSAEKIEELEAGEEKEFVDLDGRKFLVKRSTDDLFKITPFNETNKKDSKIEKSKNMQNTFENLGLGGLNLDSFTNIEKGKKFPIGTISNGYKKIAEGKWQKVSEYGMTKNEHERKYIAHEKMSQDEGQSDIVRNRLANEAKKHKKALDSLDDKEYSDTDVIGKKENKQADDKDDEKEGLKENENYDKFMANKKKVKDVIDERGNYKEGTTDIDKDGKLTLKKGNEFTSIPSFDDMQKSHITNMFGYGDSSIKIEKTGAEIKQSLEEIKSKNDIAKQSSYDKIELLVGEIGTQPTEECERYSMEGLEDKVGIMPKKYRWQEIYQDDTSVVSNGLGISSQPTEQKPNEKKRAYNNEVDKYVDICVENIQLDTMINNINLTKKYSLTIKQASVLGF